jgi:hypothetical protein
MAKVKSIKALKKKAIQVFNKWIRERDKEKGCISCGGGVHNAGHFYHGHIYSALQFNEVNVQGQCVHCNLSKAGNEKGFRQGLIRRYGQDKVDLLDSAARHRKQWTVLELEQIIKHYDTRN